MREENLAKVKELLFPTKRIQEKEVPDSEKRILLTTTDLAIEVYRMLLDNGSGRLTKSDLQKLLQIHKDQSYHNHTVESMVDAIWSIAIYDPNCVIDWIKILIEPFSFDTGADACCPADFKKACFLGIFKISDWLDQEGRSNAKFEKEFLAITKKFILCKNSETNHMDEYLGTKLESQLSQYIKGWLKRHPRRFKKFIQLISEVNPSLENDEKNLSKIGMIIFNQIFYACWSSLSRQGRAIALTLLPATYYPQEITG